MLFTWVHFIDTLINYFPSICCIIEHITVFLEMELEPSERQNSLERDKIKTNPHCGELEMTISRKRGFCLPSFVEKI